MDLERIAAQRRAEQVAGADLRANEPRDWLYVPVVRVPCLRCGLDHSPAARQVRLARMLPTTAKEIADAYPCTYGNSHGSASARQLYRDLTALGAVRGRDGVWSPPGAR